MRICTLHLLNATGYILWEHIVDLAVSLCHDRMQMLGVNVRPLCDLVVCSNQQTLNDMFSKGRNDNFDLLLEPPTIHLAPKLLANHMSRKVELGPLVLTNRLGLDNVTLSHDVKI